MSDECLCQWNRTNLACKMEKDLLRSDGENMTSLISVNCDILQSDYRDESNTDNQHEIAIEEHDEEYDEPRSKKIRLVKDDKNELEQCRDLLKEMYKSCINHTRDIQITISHITRRFQNLEEKIDNTLNHTRGISNLPVQTNNKAGTVLVGLPQNMENNVTKIPHVGPNVTLITLNSEDDFPNGSWLGDENNPEQRVRCSISASDLTNINRTCHTPEKMALTLLDYLFDRETQACSNISGLGKHGKRQLDPLMIYGIRCHLMMKFNVTDTDWHRIKQNLDSKCRTAFRRKKKGMPLTVKAFRDKWIPQEPAIRIPTTAYIQMVTNSNQSELNREDLTDSELTTDCADLQSTNIVNMQPVSFMMEDVGERQIIHTSQGDIQLIRATPEQLAHFQNSGQLQVLAAEHLSLESP